MRKTVVGIYTRVSTQEQASEGYSIGEQRNRLEKYAEAHDWIVYKWYNDPGFSGGSTDRPGLQSMIKDVENHRLDKVIVYKLDRLSRSQKDTLYLIEDVFLTNGVDFVSMTENFDTGTPLGRAMIGILSVFAQLEREQIKERMQIGLDARAKDGYYHGGPYAPIGYDYEDGFLKINEYEALQVRKIYDLFLTGMPVYSIYKYMLAHYSGHKYGNWTNSAIRSCLTSVIYTGQVQWKGEIYPGKHDAIIDPEMFNRVAETFKERSLGEKYRKHPFKRTTLLGGIIFCGKCGARYYCKQNVSKRPGITPAQRYYTCYSRGKSSKSMIRDPNCKNKTWNVKTLDQMIIDEIQKLAFDSSYLDTIRDQETKGTEERDRAVIVKQIKQIGKQIDKLVDLYSLDRIDFNSLNERIKKLSDERETLEAELDNIQEEKPDLSIEETRTILKDFDQILASADQERLKEIVHSLIDAIIINGDDFEIHWKFL